MKRDTKAILASTTPQVQETVNAILDIEKEYQHFQDLKSARKLDEVKSRLIKLFEKETK